MKKIITLLLSLTCIFSSLMLFSCSGGVSDGTPESQKSTEEEKESGEEDEEENKIPKSNKYASRFDTASHVVQALISDLNITQGSTTVNPSIYRSAVNNNDTKVYVDVQTEDGTVQIVLSYLDAIKTTLLNTEDLEFNKNYNAEVAQCFGAAPENVYCVVGKENDTKASIVFCYAGISGDNSQIIQVWKFINYVDSEDNFHTKIVVYWSKPSDYYYDIDIMKNDEECICAMGYGGEDGYQYSYSFADKNGKYISVQPAQAAYVYKDSNGGLYYFNNKYNRPENPEKLYTFFNADESFIMRKYTNGITSNYVYTAYSLTGITEADLQPFGEEGLTNSEPGHNNQNSEVVTTNVYSTDSDTLPAGVTFPQADFVAALEQKVDPALNDIKNLCEIVILTDQKVADSKAALSEYLVNVTVPDTN